MPSGEKAVNVFVGNAGEGRVKIVHLSGRYFLKHRRQLLRNLFAAKFHQAETRAIVKNYYQQQSPYHGDMNTLLFAFMRESRELLFADECGHTAGRGDVSGGE